MTRNWGAVRGALVSIFIAAAAGAFAQAAGTSAPPPGPPPINGTIVSITGNLIKLALADKSEKDVALDARTVVLERDAVTASDIKPGDAMGVAARRDGMNLVATSINIFAPQMWSSPQMRKGQWPMASGETMTNAEVTDYAVGMSGHTLTMKYNDVNASIAVPDGIPIHRLVVVKLAALTAGMTVQIRDVPGSDGTAKAAAISFEGPAKT